MVQPAKPGIKQQIIDFVDQEPFRNFAIITSAGLRYDITNPLARAVADEMVHYYPSHDRSLHVPYNQIATVEELAIPKESKRAK